MAQISARLSAVACLALTLATTSVARADTTPDAGVTEQADAGISVVDNHDTPTKTGLGFGVLPAINFDADNGFGFGVLGSIYSYDGATKPYRVAVTVLIFATSKFVQSHFLQLDWLRVANLPLRISARLGYLQSLTQNYCGLGALVTCDPGAAHEAGVNASLSGEALARFETRYYQRRIINPHGLVNLRWALLQKPATFELFLGYRGFYFLPGNWFVDENEDHQPDLFPYPGSLYAQAFPDGEAGFDSVVQAGVMYDSRDNEPAPTRGVWLEASLRAAGRFLGSNWTWGGANVTARTYLSLTTNRTLVFANRFTFDGVIGSPPVEELSHLGGSNDSYLFGGADVGRGIRLQRFLGKLRLIDQAEIRWRFVNFTLFSQHFGLTAVAFFDGAFIGTELIAPGPMPLNFGFGASLRLSWNENFIIRADLGVSPVEHYLPSLYITVGTPF